MARFRIDGSKDRVFQFFRSVASAAPISEQVSIASSLHIPRERRIGGGHDLMPTCRDIRAAVETFLQQGDTLVVSDIYVIASNWPAVYDTMRWIRRRGISLCIYDQYYYDHLCLDKDGKLYSATRHFDMFSAMYTLMEKRKTVSRSPAKKLPPRKGARGRRPITLQSIDDKEVMKAFRRYCTDKTMMKRELIDILMKQGINISSSTFYNLVHEMNALLQEEHSDDPDYKPIRSR